MSTPLDRTSAVADVAHRWNELGYEYAVAHGVESYPVATGRDIDVMFRAGDIPLALAAAERVLLDGGWRVVKPRAIWGPRLVAVDLCGAAMLEIHLHSRLAWRNVVVVDEIRSNEGPGPFRTDPWVGWAKRVLLPILAGDAARMVARPDEFQFRPLEEEAARERLPAILGPRSESLLAHLKKSGATGLSSLIGGVRRSATRRAVLNRPMRALAWPAVAVSRRMLLPFATCAPVVAVVGPDGAGKSTVLAGLRASRDWVFVDVVERHWRPNVLPRLGALVGRPAPSEEAPNPPRRTGGRFRWFRILYYALDVFVGGWLVDRPAAARQNLVLYDRCFLDMAVDPERYGLTSGAGILFFWRAMPKPDAVILLSGDPETIFSRKHETSAAEVAIQLNEWKRLESQGHVDHVLDSSGEPDAVLARARELVLQAFLSVNGATK